MVKVNDISSFVDVIQNLISNPTKTRFKGGKRSGFVKQNYDSKKVVKKSLSIYKQ